jgi:hypothetical protein
MMRNKRNVFTWRKPRTIVRARQTFLFMVKRAIYDVPKRSGKENREIAIERFFPLQQKTRERDEDFQDFATLNACVFGFFRLSGKRNDTTKLLLLRLGGVRTRTPSREAAARQTPPVRVKGG